MDLSSCDLDSHKKDNGVPLMKNILEKANLSQYYEAFISHGGDDVNQLCEAGEEEFLEIMALVGMATKPLHVRRLQKVLHEWVLLPDTMKKATNIKPSHPLATGSIASLAHTQHRNKRQASPSQLLNSIQEIQNSSYPSFLHQFNLPSSYYDALLASSRSTELGMGLSCNSYSEVLARYNDLAASSRLGNISNFGARTHSSSASKLHSNNDNYPYIGKISPNSEISDNEADISTNGHVAYSLSDYPLYPPGSNLLESHLLIIESMTRDYVSSLPMYAPKPLNMKKPVDREIEETMMLGSDDPCRLDLFRKYSAIYGRFDSKRNKEKHMNFHEMCVNEAAAQLCLHRPALLTRREDLFFQARQVVKIAAPRLKGHQRNKDDRDEVTNDIAKRIKTELNDSKIHNYEKSWLGVERQSDVANASSNGINLSTDELRHARQYTSDLAPLDPTHLSGFNH